MDFLFPHLENVREIGRALTGKPFANVWMIAERVWSAKKDKETNSIDETIPLRGLFEMGYSAREVRYWLLVTHYRKPIHAGLESLGNAVSGLRRIDEFITKVTATRGSDEPDSPLSEMADTLEQEFLEALSDDLNVPRALAAVFRFIRRANPVLDRSGASHSQKRQITDVFGKINDVLGVFDLGRQPLAPTEDALIRKRDHARKSKNWEEADRIRNDLLQCGIRVIDTPSGSRWEHFKPESIRPKQ